MSVMSTSNVIVAVCLVTVGFAFAAEGELIDQYHRKLRTDCAVINDETVDSFRKLESTTRLVYFTEVNEGVQLVWAYSHAEPFFSLEEDFKRFAIVISKHLVVHMNVNISINNCTLNRTSVQYKTVVVERLTPTLLVDVAKMVGTVCYKTRQKRESYHCCRPGGDELSIVCDLEERSVIWLKVLKVLIVVVVVILGYVYVPLLTSRIYSHPPSLQDLRPIELTSRDLHDCLYVYLQACQNRNHKLGQFLYGFCLVPFVGYVSVALYFTWDWPSFVSVLLEPMSLFCFTCYCLREVLNFFLEANGENAEHKCLMCCLSDEEPVDSCGAIPEPLSLLLCRIIKAAKCIFKYYKECTVGYIDRRCTLEYMFRRLLCVPLSVVCFAWFLLSIPSCILLAFPAYSSAREGHYWWPLSHHKKFSDKSITLKTIVVGVLEFFLNICACTGYVIVGSLTAYFLVHVSVYVIMLLTLDFDCLTYATCLFLVVFYICYCVRSLAAKYGRLKLVIFACYKPSRDGRYSTQGSADGNENYSLGDQDDQESTIPGDLYLAVCNKIEPKFKNFLLMLLNLVIFLTFVFVVTACVIIFGPRPGGASALVRSLIALVVGLSPKVTNMFSPSKTDKEKKYLNVENQVNKEVHLYLLNQNSLELEYRGLNSARAQGREPCLHGGGFCGPRCGKAESI